MSVCPVLRRGEGGFICGYTNRPIDPFSWYCVGNYSECPIFIRYSREARPAPKPEEVPKPLAEVLSIAAERPETEFEKAIKPVIDNVVLKYDDMVKKLDSMWSEYEGNVVNARRQWEVEKMALLRAQDLLNRTIGDYEKMLAELELKREFMPPDAFENTRRDLSERLEALRNLLEEVRSKYNALEEGLGSHFKRVLATSTSAEVISLKLSLSKLEELLKEGKISRETYEKLKSELEGLLK
ncbi:MAG: hypothetical protein OWQ51_07830 [Pyrobaculum arsenaticum]|uniref:Uncharacterized protein n=2 Tax=Pyrobaculum arsenaticum TaxID=121277 RepID=A4WH29_PYRAR|nr:hypothetical protein [Pyrobaculum arsenaticum]ABP49696.1 conserved hypothetical protein [Pyrobaculum arsenaticum DSM 13514]MCY0890871.1 hypothetical protein [Pyrobaculum arsenaticum]NYR15682.1 hypothetical protein [Pyrobaculum arsenaticum]